MVRTLGNGYIEYDPELTGYLVSGQDAARIADLHAQLPVAVPPGNGLAFAFLPREDLDAAKAYVSCLYPGGVAGEVRSHAASGSAHFFDTYVVPPERASDGAARADDCSTAEGGAAGLR